MHLFSVSHLTEMDIFVTKVPENYHYDEKNTENCHKTAISRNFLFNSQ